MDKSVRNFIINSNRLIDNPNVPEIRKLELFKIRAFLYRKFKENLGIDSMINSDHPDLMLFSKYRSRRSEGCYT